MNFGGSFASLLLACVLWTSRVLAEDASDAGALAPLPPPVTASDAADASAPPPVLAPAPRQRVTTTPPVEEDLSAPSGPLYVKPPPVLESAGKEGTFAIDSLSAIRVQAAGDDFAPSLSGLVGFTTRLRTDPQGIGIRETAFSLAPRFDYFPVDGFSVGGALEFSYIDRRSTGTISDRVGFSASSTTFKLAVRGGYLTNVSNRWAFWPRLQVGVLSQSDSQAVSAIINSATPADLRLWFDLDLPFLVRVNTTLYVSMGPSVTWAPAKLAGKSTTSVFAPGAALGFGVFL
jgi:hypothetical protein